jgi:hypothetical protein
LKKFGPNSIWIPKLADFGMARKFKNDYSQTINGVGINKEIYILVLQVTIKFSKINFFICKNKGKFYSF